MTRGSTKEQVLTLDAQRASQERYCAMKQWTIVQEFVDSGTDGKSTFLDRPVVREMLAFMEKENVRQIVCTRLDRAFRSTGDAILTIDTLYKHGVMFHLCEQGFDPTTPSGRANFQMMAMFAEFESSVRRLRQLEAFDQQRVLRQKSGVNVPYGWRAVLADGRLTKERRQASDLVPDPEQQVVLGDILQRHADGQSDKHIAKILNQAGIPTAKAGQTIKYRGVTKTVKGKWSARTVFSVRSFARLADDRFASANLDDVEDAATALT